ncbi:acetyltransferase [Euhalothece natronophila Z-M001]|uniref:Acetyltransferase n=1 Tax=Euhalothece natronophila Z-M001 TaxID=522448 RepID=A0A5B8NNL9_9CHRO|nr:acetyltransferase [Euhalothece natronophila]QDZ40161.1 acetyltransferase [Euhalothece natronophila Z-M001]
MLDQQKRNCSPEEIEQAITELERYRERIVNDLFQSARRVDVSHKATMANIGKNPEILRIDAEIEKLQEQQSQLR